MGQQWNPPFHRLSQTSTWSTYRRLPCALPLTLLDYGSDMWTCVIWPLGQEKLDCFHEHLNMQDRNIKFTVEYEKVNKLAFLDVQVTRTG